MLAGSLHLPKSTACRRTSMDSIPMRYIAFSIPTAPSPRDPTQPHNGLAALKDEDGCHLYVYFSRVQAMRIIHTHARLESALQDTRAKAIERGVFSSHPPEMIHMTGLEAESFCAALCFAYVLAKGEKSPEPQLPNEKGVFTFLIPHAHVRTAGIGVVDNGAAHVHVFYSRIQARDILARYGATETELSPADVISKSGLEEISPQPTIEIQGHAAERLRKAFLVLQQREHLISEYTGDEGAYTFVL